MAKVTSRFQVTIPKRVADACGITPGDDIEFVAAGPCIRVIKRGHRLDEASTAERLALFDRATARQKARQRSAPRRERRRSREWQRDSLYDRGRAR